MTRTKPSWQKKKTYKIYSRINGENGYVPAVGDVYGHFGIHKTTAGNIHVTHLNTGLAVTRCANTLKQARALVVDLEKFKVWDFHESDKAKYDDKLDEIKLLVSKANEKIIRKITKRRKGMKNECAKMRDKNNPYEIWQGGGWTWEVLKKYQREDLEAKNEYARWFCNVISPYCPDGEMGDVYVRDIKSSARWIA